MKKFLILSQKNQPIESVSKITRPTKSLILPLKATFYVCFNEQITYITRKKTISYTQMFFLSYYKTFFYKTLISFSVFNQPLFLSVWGISILFVTTLFLFVFFFFGKILSSFTKIFYVFVFLYSIQHTNLPTFLIHMKKNCEKN